MRGDFTRIVIQVAWSLHSSYIYDNNNKRMTSEKYKRDALD